MKKLAITLVVLCSTLTSVLAQVDLNDNCTLAYADIIALRFDDARSKLTIERSDNPGNLMIPYLENYMDFLTVFIGEDEEEFDRLEENKDGRINQIKKLDDTCRFRNYMLGNIHLQWAVARLKFKQYITAALELNRAYRLLERNAEEFPAFVPNNISLGVLHIMIGMVPDKYRWMLDIMSINGSVEQGREELYLVLELSSKEDRYSYLYDETLFYLGFVELNILPDPDEIEILQHRLELASDNNLLLTYLDINILMKTGQNDMALANFSELHGKRDAYVPFYYLDYLLGECHLRNLDIPQATNHYDLFLDNFKGRNYIKDACRKKAWAFLIAGDVDQYRREMIDLQEKGFEDVDVDKEAQREAESGLVPNVDLIKARLLFDGGYYRRADSVLQSADTTGQTPSMVVERFYRKARIAHESGNIALSKDLYLRTIEQGSEMKRYFAGNSALKLGEIYEAEKNITTALFYYQLCLDLDFDEYENSIHSKANAAIDRLSD